MDGIKFYSELLNILAPNDPLSTDGSYSFICWTTNGRLKYNVNNSITQPTYKYIEPEILVVAKHWHEKGIAITYNWLKQNGHDNYCTPVVLNFLLSNYS